MPRIQLETFIAAPIERCFDAARDVELHARTAASTGEQVVGGRTHGLLELGDEVTFEARHLGIRQRLTARVTRCDRPFLLEDQMVRGAFAGFTHRHLFRTEGAGTVMTDDFEYLSPLGVLGRIADALFLERHLRGFLSQRAWALKAILEREGGGA